MCLAGSHLTLNAEKIKKENGFVKYLLKGEYISSSLRMAKLRTPGIYESEVVTDLDKIPVPFRDFEAAIRYIDPTMPTAQPQLQIYASKGCPFKCVFCLWPQTMYNRKVSYRKPEMIAAEIKECVSDYGYKSIFFDDDTFNVGNERIGKLCDELKKIGLPWTMMGRLDCSPDWLFDKMVDSGCVGMRFGVESFNTEVLANIKKGLENKDFLKTLKHITERHPDLMIHLTMMKELPGQTNEIHELDMKILSDLGYSVDNMKRSYQLASCVPFPGTELYDVLSRDEKNKTIMDNDNLLFDGGQNTVMKKIKNKNEE